MTIGYAHYSDEDGDNLEGVAFGLGGQAVAYIGEEEFLYAGIDTSLSYDTASDRLCADDGCIEWQSIFSGDVLAILGASIDERKNREMWVGFGLGYTYGSNEVRIVTVGVSDDTAFHLGFKVRGGLRFGRLFMEGFGAFYGDADYVLFGEESRFGELTRVGFNVGYMF
ncbi:MAG: hypothetical protein GDA50_07010 [Alphaproteobacteria bacterium GM202ARS2]|nr:hypothetical protein [Alphaproteobacteria bacterium GM202ARS2]